MRRDKIDQTALSAMFSATGMEENLRNLKANNKNISDEKMAVEIRLTAMGTEEVTYSDVTITKTAKTNQNESVMRTEEVTYSDITIIKTAKTNQNESDTEEEEGVIYSKVKVSQKANGLDPAAPTDPSAPAKPDPADSSLKPYPQEESPTCKSLKCTAIVLLCVCVLLLAVAVTMGGLYIMKAENYSGMEENLRNLKAKNKNISDEKMAVEISLTEITQALERLQEQYDNATVMRQALEANLTEQRESNDNLTKEVTRLKHELQGVRRCADNWEHHDGTWYHFSTDRKNWNDSRDSCVAMGGYLAIVKTQTQTDFLRNKNGVYWIGLTQVQPEGDWHWVDNTNLTDPRFWGPNQPDNYTVIDPMNGEDCVNIDKGVWNDNACGTHLKRICESKSCRL